MSLCTREVLLLCKTAVPVHDKRDVVRDGPALQHCNQEHAHPVPELLPQQRQWCQQHVPHSHRRLYFCVRAKPFFLFVCNEWAQREKK